MSQKKFSRTHEKEGDSGELQRERQQPKTA